MSKHKRQKKKPISGTEAAEKSSKPKTEVTAVVKAYAHPTSEPIVKAPAKAPAKTPAKTPAKPADKSTNTTTARATGKPTLKSAITPGVNPVAKSGVKQGGKQTVKPAVNPAVELGEKPGPKITAKAGLDSRAKPGAKPRREAKKKRFNVVDAWQEYWGQGVLTDWQRLCQDLGVHGDLTTKDKCREAMKDVWVNIHDFLQARHKLTVTHFPTERALSEYTLASKKRYPRNKIEKDSPLELLMAHIDYEPWAKEQAEEVKKKEHEKNNPRKYRFVPPPETYGKRQKQAKPGV